MIPDDSLDAAWAAAEAAVPEGWRGPSVGPGRNCWRAFAWEYATPHRDPTSGEGDTPAAALRALAVILAEKSER